MCTKPPEETNLARVTEVILHAFRAMNRPAAGKYPAHLRTTMAWDESEARKTRTPPLCPI
jgi:hypothetical protein